MASLGQLQRLMSWSGGPVNWDLADEVAKATLAQGRADAADSPPPRSDPDMDAEQTRAVADAGRLAEVWLDAATTLPGAGADPQAWTRQGWLEGTRGAWRPLVEPVAARVTQAMGTALGSALEQGVSGGGLPPELGALLGAGGGEQVAGMMRQIGGLAFGAQVGQALGALAHEVLSTSEIGLPLGASALLPTNVTAFAEGLSIPAGEVFVYVALREAAHQRLFAHVPWLRAHLYDTVEAFSRGIDIDLSALEEAVSGLDLSDPAAAQRALTGGLFTPTPTADQQLALARLETALALLEGWVDVVVHEASASRLPHAAALRETIRRRRASGGPAEQTFASLVGLQLRPRRLREAATLWSHITHQRGVEGRDALWAHPDLLPTAADLDEPLDWGISDANDVERDWDAGLRALDRENRDGEDDRG